MSPGAYERGDTQFMQSPVLAAPERRIERLQFSGLHPGPLDEVVDVLASEVEGPTHARPPVLSHAVALDAAEVAVLNEPVHGPRSDPEQLGRRWDGDCVVGRFRHGRDARSRGNANDRDQMSSTR